MKSFSCEGLSDNPMYIKDFCYFIASFFDL